MESPSGDIIADRSTIATDFPSMLPGEPRSTSLSPLRPGSTLVAYQPNGATGPRTPGRMGKSQHIAQIRSLGLLHDLQEYISSVECLAADQKRELEKVREEKRDMERCLARAEVAAQERPPAPTLDFSVTEVADLPPRLRALVEDNRGLRELVKRYKYRNASLEHQLVQMQAQMLALADANERLKQSLAECSRTPAEVEREENLRRQLDVKSRQVDNLEHGMGILRSKMETDSKLYRQNLTSAAREKDALKRQLVAVNKTLEERDKEVRALNVELRRIRRGAPPTRGGPAYHPPAFPSGGSTGDDDAGAGGAAAAATASTTKAPGQATATSPPAEPEERIRIMLMIVRDEIRVEVPVPVPVPVPMVTETPATPLLGSPRGTSEEGYRPEDEPQSSMEQQPEADPQPEPEPALEPEALEPSSKSPPEEPVPEPVPDPVPEPEPAVADQPAPEPLAEEASPRSPPSAVLDGDYEPSVVGLMEDGTLTAEHSVVGMGVEGPANPEDDEAAAAVDAPEPAPEPIEAQAQVDVGGVMHVHASAPLPIPYSRTQARATTGKVGSISAKISAHPVTHGPPMTGSTGSGAAPGAAAAPAPAVGGSAGPASASISRKPSGGGNPPPVGGSASVSVRGGPSLKAVGAASKKQMA